MLLSTFEANVTLRLRVRHTSFYLFPLASSCTNDYFRAYAIIDFLANWLVFPNMVTHLASESASVNITMLLHLV